MRTHFQSEVLNKYKAVLLYKRKQTVSDS